MTLPKINPTTTKSWKLLENCSKEEDIKALFKSNINRANDFSISFEDFHLDFSKNMISKNVMGLLLNLAEECHLKKAIQCQFCLLYTSPSPRDRQKSRMPSSA